MIAAGRRWSSPDGKVVYEEVERFDDADYAGTINGCVAHMAMLETDNEWCVGEFKESTGKALELTWVRRVFGGER